MFKNPRAIAIHPAITASSQSRQSRADDDDGFISHDPGAQCVIEFWNFLNGRKHGGGHTLASSRNFVVKALFTGKTDARKSTPERCVSLAACCFYRMARLLG